MQKISSSASGFFNVRSLLAFSLCGVAVLLAIASLGGRTGNAAAATITSGARIYVTTTVQKIGVVGTGGCSLQEAIYSSVLHQSVIDANGIAHGIAIDWTDPDHFIPTDCVPGTGNSDTIVLPSGGVFNLNKYLDGDAHNPYGPTATPIIFSTMTIEGNGATLQWTGGSANVRMFAVGPASVTINQDGLNTTVSGTGVLTLRDVYIKGFHVKGGDGGPSAGGGMGAGGAIYVQYGALIVENSTFDSNRAIGGNGGAGGYGGGGGIWGTGGGTGPFGGGGGGGSKGNGGKGDAGGGGGTVFSGGRSGVGGPGGYLFGGQGGNNGQAGQGSGGGGGGGTIYVCVPGTGEECDGNGGNGAYAGGGGGGPGDGGAGGFGGGGGAGGVGNGGNGGFGGGGGSALSPGNGGAFGGHADPENGGGGAGLGGAIFSDGVGVTIRNSTFYNNSAAQGLANTAACNCGSPASNGDGVGGAVFSRNGSLTLVDVTI